MDIQKQILQHPNLSTIPARIFLFQQEQATRAVYVQTTQESSAGEEMTTVSSVTAAAEDKVIIQH